ncbi:MAG TPA: carbonic anhydrase [Bacteroidia bacterium]|jgi:carbonic anhydrase|nr:carbonic anhydrase [Bacteroidia bacterium]HQF27770.1 carbonic anhydrase [Bacteroidia bacterium]HQK97049.1 carbonic anhydrase [Bacteroidia bacterium]
MGNNTSYQRLLDGNKEWSKAKLKADPEFFNNLTKGQTPQYLWIGCSDSRVPANEITNTKSGEIFVHRNVANLVLHTDVNLLSVLHYAVEVLHVEHIIVCGHYGCGGVIAAMENHDFGIVNKWLRNIKEVYAKYVDELEAIEDITERSNRLVELNVMEQVKNLAKTTVVQKAWEKRALAIHGWVYGFNNGIITDLNCMINELNDLEPIFRYRLSSDTSE